jgi:hypothetical protein
MQKLSKIFIPLLAVVVILGGLYFLVSKKSAPSSPGNFEWKVSQVKDSMSPPKYELDVYLTGDRISEVSAIELDAAVDVKNLKLTSAESGGFFVNPLTVKMDNTNMIFAIAKNPSGEIPVDPTKPVFKLYFQSQAGFTQAVFDVLPTSQIYVKNTGGANPSVTQFVLYK